MTDSVAASAREFFTSFVGAINARDMVALESMFHPDFVADIPQSGERSRGFAGFWAQLEAYPDGDQIAAELPEAKLLGDEDRWAITPAYTVVPLSASNEFTVMYRSVYPDGSAWLVIGLVELRDGKLYRMENYFAPELAAPLHTIIGVGGRG